MAAISQILAKRWPGRLWTLTDENYATLVWDPANPEAKPTLAAIQAFSAAVDLEIAADLRDERRDSALMGTAPGQMFKAFDIIVDYLAALHPALPGNVANQIPANVVTRAQALRNRLNEILAQIP